MRWIALALGLGGLVVFAVALFVADGDDTALADGASAPALVDARPASHPTSIAAARAPQVATPVAVAPPAREALAPTIVVRGKVVDDAGATIPRARARCESPRADDEDAAQGAACGSDGTFE